MAKRKSGAKDLARPDTLKLSADLVIDTKMKVGAILYLEDKYGKPIQEIDFGSGRMADFVNLIVALAMQHDPKLSEAEALARAKRIDASDLNALDSQLEKLFAADLKNSRRPVKGNLMEA